MRVDSTVNMKRCKHKYIFIKTIEPKIGIDYALLYCEKCGRVIRRKIKTEVR